MIVRDIHQYRMIEKLGAGGMGEVYLAEDTKLSRKVAIKILLPKSRDDESAKRRFLREAQAVAKLDHPNICAIHELGEKDGFSYIVMQYIEGDMLASKKGQLNPQEAINIGIQIAEALSEAHSRGIIHRDIKPQNVIITPRGQVKVLDFGLAKMELASGVAYSDVETLSVLTMPGFIMGTAPYMSPEQANGKIVDTRSDLFSLGVVLYECLAGRRPFTGATPLEVCAQVLQFEQPPPSEFNPRVPPELNQVIQKALAKKPDSRYQTADEMIADLRTVSLQLESAEQKTTAEFPPRLDSFRHAIERFTSAGPTHQRRLLLILLASFATLLMALWLLSQSWVATRHQPRREAVRWYEDGTKAIRDGAYLKASAALEQALRLDDDFVNAHARLAEAWMELDYSERANREILRAHSLAPDLSRLPKLEALHVRAVTDVVAQNFVKAIESYAEIVALQPSSESAYVDLGRAFEKNEEIDRALNCYNSAANLDPDYAPAFLRSGILYSRKLEREKALAAFAKAESIYQTRGDFEGVTEVLYNRGLHYQSVGVHAEARDQLRKALGIIQSATDNVHQKIRVLLLLSSLSLSESQTVAARDNANEAIALSQEHGIENLAAQGLIDLGNAFYVRREYREAEKYYKQALQYALRNNGLRNEAMAQLALGKLYIQQGLQPDEGLDAIERSLAFFQRGGYAALASQAQLLRGRAKLQQGDYDGAFQEFDQQLQRAEQLNAPAQLASSHILIANLLVDQEVYDRAFSHFESSYRINVSQGNQLHAGYSLLGQGDMLWRLGRYDESEAALAQVPAIANSLDSDYRRVLLARTFLVGAQKALSRRRFSEARQKCRRALDLAGSTITRAAIEATYTLGQALALSGGGLRGTELCAKAVDMASRESDPKLLSNALFALAEAALESGDRPSALRVALEAQKRFGAAKQQESDWRTLLIAGLASPGNANGEAEPQHLEAARRVLLRLETDWGTTAFTGYLSRPDILFYRKRLEDGLAKHR